MKILLKNDNSLSECYLRYCEDLEESDKYDAIVSTQDATTEVLEQFKNLLVIERGDSAEVRKRRILAHPSVTTFVKMYCYKKLENHNEEAIRGRVFLKYIATPEEFAKYAKKPEQITPEDFSKIVPGFNFMHYKRLEPLFELLKTAEVKPKNDRIIDMFFAGTTEYVKNTIAFDHEIIAGQLINQHRQHCIEEIEEFGRNGYNVEVIRGRGLKFNEYIKKLLDTKIIPSPFGWGEMCHRDYEAELCGCIVKKPFFDEIIHSPRGESLIQDKLNEKNIIKEILK